MFAGHPYRRRFRVLISRRVFAALLALGTAAVSATCGGSTAVETVTGPDAVRCQTTVSGPSNAVSPDGGTVSINVTAARDCSWSASTESAWMQLGATSGQGNGTVAVTVSRNEQPAARSGAVAVNDQRVTVSQEPHPCVYVLRASPSHFSGGGGRGTVAVEVLSGCAWSATSSAPWITIVTSSGTGNGTADFNVSSNAGAAREASVSIAGQTVTIQQDSATGGNAPEPPQPGCTVTLTPDTITAAAAGGTHTVAIATGRACDWMATSSASWLTFTSATTGRGNANLALSVARNTGNARTAQVTVGQQTATVNQAGAPACTVSIDPSSHTFPATGGDGRVRVTTQDGCEWSTSGSPSWITVTNGRGTGNGEARYTVHANGATTARSDALTIGGRTHSVTQQAAAPTCTYSLSPASRSFPAAGGEARVQVNTQAGCTWKATGAPSWVAVSGEQGTGPGEFTYTVQSNTASSARSGSIAVGGQAHAISQEAAASTCTYSIEPPSRHFGANGGDGRISVATQDGCSWSASSGDPWASVTTTSGTGAGDVMYTVRANGTTTQRATSITVNGKTHAVTQDAAAPTCTYSLQPASSSFPSAGGDGRFDVVTQAGCGWTVSAGVPWIAITSNRGEGPGRVAFSVQANTTAMARSTGISVEGQTHTVSQEAAPASCTYTLQPTSLDFSAAGGGGRFSVTTQAGCAWEASSNQAWVAVGTPTGSGPGEVTYTVQSNSAASARSATIAVNGHGHSVNQDAAAPPPPPPPCDFAIDPVLLRFGRQGGEGVVHVVTTASCTWTASSPVSWITLATSGGTGPGDLRYTVAPSSEDRAATLSVAGQPHRVEQTEGR